jgi:hypothetical protein
VAFILDVSNHVEATGGPCLIHGFDPHYSAPLRSAILPCRSILFPAVGVASPRVFKNPVWRPVRLCPSTLSEMPRTSVTGATLCKSCIVQTPLKEKGRMHQCFPSFGRKRSWCVCC